MSKKQINATHYEDIPAYPNGGKAARRVNAIIETPKGVFHKYALKPDYGIIAFGELMPDGLHWPFDYGFVPQTLADDGDPLDILVLTQHGLFSGCLIGAVVVGAVREAKDGIENDRLIAVPAPSPGASQPTDEYRDIADVPSDTVSGIVAYLKRYSEAQGHRIEVHAIVGADDAMALVKKAMKAFKKAKRSRT